MNVRLVLLWVFISIVVLGCATTALNTIEIGDSQNCQHRILIATQHSEFKDVVIEKMMKTLENDSCYLKRIDLTNLSDEDPETYQVIAISSPYQMMRVKGELKSFIKTTKDKRKIVALITTGKEGRVVKLEEIDAISSASNLVKTETVATAMIAKVRRVLNSQ